MAKSKKEHIEEPKETSQQILQKLKTDINAHYERKVCIIGSEKEELNKIPTGILSFDIESEGGIPRGRWIILVGEESTFKSSLMYHIGGKMQRVCASCMRGILVEKNFKKVKVPSIIGAVSSDVMKVEKGEAYSKKYLADKFLRNAYCPGELMTHKKDLVLLEYELECSCCNNPEYSIFLLVDSERNYTKNWARKWGVIHHYVALSDTSHSQMTGDIMREALNTGKVSFVAIDSLDSHGPVEENSASVSGDTNILVKKDNIISYVPIENLVDSLFEDIETVCFDGNNFEWKKIKNVWEVPDKEVYHIHTRYGRDISVTGDHSIYRVNKTNRRKNIQNCYIYDGVLELVKTEELEVGDYVLLSNFNFGTSEGYLDLRPYQKLSIGSNYNQCHIASDELKDIIRKDKRFSNHSGYARYEKGAFGCHAPLSWFDDIHGKLYYTGAKSWANTKIPLKQLAYLLGVFLGDGNVHQDGIVISSGTYKHKKLFNKIDGEWKGLIYPEPREHQRSKRNDWTIYVQCKPLALFFTHYFAGKTALTKEFPEIVWSWNAELKRLLLQGLIDTDGHVNKAGRIIISTSSPKMRDDICLLLSSLNVIAGVSKRVQKKPCWIGEQRIFTKNPNYMISFTSGALEGKNEGHKGQVNPCVRVDSGYPVQISSIEKLSGKRKVYDIEVGDNSNFVGNGILLHNSLEDNQMGLQARVWNKIVRVITNKLNSTFIYMYENKEGKKVAEEKHPEPVVGIIQQWRERIGAYGDPKVMGGGKGKNFASAMTVDMSAGEKEWVMEGNPPRKAYAKGINFNFRFRKHKAGRVERKGSFYFDLMKLEVDNFDAVFNYALKFNLIERAGAWYTVGKERFQGESKVKEYLRNNSKVYEKLTEEIMEKSKV